MSLHKDFGHLQIRLADILVATNNFADENVIGQGGSGKIYKGQLLHREQSIEIVVRRYTTYKEFWMEISMLDSLKHPNLISIVGYCAEEGEMIIISRHEANGSLDKYLSDPTLKWIRRLQICVGVAKVLSYIYYDERRDFSVIHRNIRSSKILLDGNWEPKLSGFGLSMKNLADRRHRLRTADPCGKLGYIDPTYLKRGNVTHKSDIYSFGVVLFEVLCGSKDIIIKDKENRFIDQLAKSQYQKRKLDDLISADLREQMNPQSLNIFSETAYHCLNEQRSQRPNIDQILMKLQEALKHQERHENQEDGMVEVEDTSSSKKWKGKSLEHLKIPLIDIQLATNYFDEECLIGSGTYGKVYKAKLVVPIEEKNKGELLKKPRTVAVKTLIDGDKDGEEGFMAEIELLTSCKDPNIVSLLGFCDEGPHMILVYEYAPNGSLDGYLGTSKLTNLTWVQRIKICIDIGRGLNHLHTRVEDERRIVHRDIKSSNILLDRNWEAKIADFGLSKFYPANKQSKTISTKNIAGTPCYLDPEYMETGRLKKESDIYSFGVVLFEILSGKLANHQIYKAENVLGIGPVARRHYEKGTIKEMVDPKIMEEVDELISTLNIGPNQASLNIFSDIAYRCLAATQAERPTAKVIIEELEKALYCQENNKDNLKFSFEDIKLATKNFSHENLIGRGGFGKVYKGEATQANGCHIIAAKQLDRTFGQGETEFNTELEILMEYKHENVIGLVGYCDEADKKIIVYEHASKGSLDRYLNDDDLKWIKRLEICIDVASGLHFLHGGGITQEVVIHRDIKTPNILLNDDWKAKISDFGLSLVCLLNQKIDYVIDNPAGTPGYVDPLYVDDGLLSKETDIYSFGVVLFEILWGRHAVPNDYRHDHGYLSVWVQRQFEEGKLDEMVFKGIKEQIVPQSLATFQTIALQCVQYNRINRPMAGEVLIQLKKALEFQEDFAIWEHKLPKDYKEILQMSKFHDTYSTINKKELYNMLSNGILLQDDKVWFSLGSNGKRNETISARKFSYKNRKSHKWRDVPESRFQIVAEMLDISNLKIKIKTRTQFLCPNVVYGVYLIFKFCDERKFSSNKAMYVNLKYKVGDESLHAHFAKWRDDQWMMIELCRFLNQKEDTILKFLLESFSRCYCGNGSVYVEGIEFRSIDNVSHEEFEKLKEVKQAWKSILNMDQVQQLPADCDMKSEKDEDSSLSDEVNGNKHLMLSAKEVLYESSNNKLYQVKKPSGDSRFEEVYELQLQQVLRIKCKIGSQMLSPLTNYACYLVFKLLEPCHGLHYPVKVQDLLRWKNKETKLLYFNPPYPFSRPDVDWVPEQRKDGWMEVMVWKFNSDCHLRKNYIPMNLKLITYEVTMSGLVICGLEVRPIYVEHL